MNWSARGAIRPEASAGTKHVLTWNHALWLGPVLAVAGFLSYYMFFVTWPIFRDTAWLNLLILGVAGFISIHGMRRGWSQGLWRKFAGVAGTTLSVLLTGVLMYYCYVLSYQLPSTDLVITEGKPLPAMRLEANDGRLIDIGEVGRDQLILVLYRGYW